MRPFPAFSAIAAMGVCTVARFDGERPVIIQGSDDMMQGSFGDTNAKYRQNFR